MFSRCSSSDRDVESRHIVQVFFVTQLWCDHSRNWRPFYPRLYRGYHRLNPTLPWVTTSGKNCLSALYYVVQLSPGVTLCILRPGVLCVLCRLCVVLKCSGPIFLLFYRCQRLKAHHVFLKLFKRSLLLVHSQVKVNQNKNDLYAISAGWLNHFFLWLFWRNMASQDTRLYKHESCIPSWRDNKETKEITWMVEWS